MRRFAVHALTALSVLLGLVAVGVWVSTAVLSARFDYTAIDRSAEPVWRATVGYLATTPHRLTLGLTRVRHDRNQSFVPLESITPPGLTWRQSTPTRADVADLRQLAPALARHAFPNTGWGDGTTTAVTVPFWAIIVLTVALPAWQLRQSMTRAQRPSTACRRCGYDVRASPGRCPECGTGRGRPAVSPPPPPASA